MNANTENESGAPDAPVTPTTEQLERSAHTERRTVGGELRYYVKDLHKHLAALEGPPVDPGLEGWFTPDGKFHAQGVAVERHNSALMAGMMGAVVVAG
ncbi:MAG: hypothetical protein Q7T71_11000 [Herbiconiux sp.]|nr:hypothetical protein [Herbiconiux sp.]